jgi:N-acetyl-gamma-glutamyl-phosphate/LysW-gamma-L-alpha-aminoadipyl-6-phosphate reductase
VVFLALPHMESQKAVPILRRHGRPGDRSSADYRLRDPNDYVTWYKAPHIDLSWPRRGGLRAGRASPQGNRAGRARRHARLLSGRSDPRRRRRCSAPGLRARRRRHRRKVGRHGRGAQGAQDRPDVPATPRPTRTCRPTAWPRTDTRPRWKQELGALAGSPAARRVHAAPRATQPRTLHDGLGAAHIERADLAAAGRLPRVLRGRAVRPRARRGRAARPRAPVVGSNYCDVAVVADPRTNRAVCVSAIDNLGKGGAANGIQNSEHHVRLGRADRTRSAARVPLAMASPELRVARGGITRCRDSRRRRRGGHQAERQEDLALIYSVDSRARCRSVHLETDQGRPVPGVRPSTCAAARLRRSWASSGCANVCTG